MAILFYIIFTIYAFIIILLLIGFIKTKPIKLAQKIEQSVSVIIAARNEALNIKSLLLQLECQNIDKLEVIMINDHSTDDTFKIAQDFKTEKYNLKVLKLTKELQGKKAALSFGIAQSNGDIIVSTDADCNVQATWLQTLISPFNNSQIQMVLGTVSFHPNHKIWDSILRFEFISLVSSGMATLYWNMPTMCNGANLAFRKSVFNSLNGYNSHIHLASGDDEFLMHQIHAHYPDGIVYCKHIESIVYTNCPEDLNSFINQRIRWGSKAKFYKSIYPKLVAIIVFLINFSLILLPFLFYFSLTNWTVLCFCFATKSILEFIYFKVVFKYFKYSNLIYIYPILFVLHPFYIVSIGILSQFKSITWKGRTY